MGGVHSRDPLGTRIMRSRSNDLNEGFGLMGLELETPIRSLALDRGADGEAWVFLEEVEAVAVLGGREMGSGTAGLFFCRICWLVTCRIKLGF